jgi:hypothetical protein
MEAPLSKTACLQSKYSVENRLPQCATAEKARGLAGRRRRGESAGAHLKIRSEPDRGRLHHCPRLGVRPAPCLRATRYFIIDAAANVLVHLFAGTQ